MTATPADADALERRLAQVLAARAADVTASGDGRRRIDGRIRRRRRFRRAGYLAAASLFVVISGVAALTAGQDRSARAPFVDTGTTAPDGGADATALPTIGPLAPIPPVDDRPLITSPAQPIWLLPGGLVPYNGSFRWATRWAWDSGFSSVGAIPLAGGRGLLAVDLNVVRSELPTVFGEWSDVDIAGHRGVKGDDGSGATVFWELGEGWVAKIHSAAGDSGVRSEVPFDEQLDAIVTSARQAVAGSAEQWIPLLEDGSVEARGDRLGLGGDDGRSYVGGFDPVSVRTELVVPGTPDGTYQLRANRWTGTLGPDGQIPQGDQLPVAGTPVELRGTRGLVAGVLDNRDTIHRVVAWREGDHQYRLFSTADVSLEDSLAVAERLRPLDDSEWAAALFPSAAPPTMYDFAWMFSPFEYPPPF